MNYAIVGCGNIAKKHVHAITTYLGSSKIISICDIVKEKAKSLGKQLDVPFFTNASEMLENLGEKIDIISILTPSGNHANNVYELVKFAKPLVIEKPIALRLEEADDILRICDSNNVKIFVVHQNRYNLPIIKMREAFEKGRFGKLVMGTVRLRWKRNQDYYDSAKWRGTWAYDGGVFTNQASHHIDMLTWFMGNIDSVKAVGATRLSKIECEDTGAAILRFSNGSIGIIEATTATRPKDLEGSISILGEKGTVVVGGFYMNKLDTWEFQDTLPEDETVFHEFGKNPDGWGYNLGEYLKGVEKALQLNQAGLIDGLEGRKSLELISGIYESIETGKEISLRFRPKECRLGLNKNDH